MSEGRIVVGIDVGTYKIATVIAKVTENVLNVLGASEVKSLGIRKGQVVAISTPDGEITSSDLARVIDAAKAVSLPSTREIIHVLPRSFVVDGQDGIKDPVGMSGTRLEVDTHIVTANSVSIRNLERAFSEVGVDVDSFAFSGYASSLAVLSDTERELGVVLIDIGAGTTDISIYVDGSVAYSSVLAIGSRHITNDLAIGIRISLESAEKIKLFLSSPPRSVRVTEEGEELWQKTSDEVDLSTLHLPEEVSKVSRKTLIDGIIRPRLNEIFTFLGLEIKKSGFGGQMPSGLVITGGGARTIGAVDSGKRSLAMPVRLGLPTNIKGIIDEIQDPSFATAVGLCVYGATLEPSSGLPFGISAPRIPNLKVNKIVSKVINLIKSFIP